MEKFEEFKQKKLDIEDSNENEYKNLNEFWFKELDPEVNELEKE